MKTGSWTWNGIDYDTCIITYDSNCVSTSDGSIPFRDEQCIFINSSSKQFYIPIYDLSSENGASFLLATNDPISLSNQAPLSEKVSEKVDLSNSNEDTSDITQLRLFHGNSNSLNFSINENKSTNYPFDNGVYYVKNNTFHISKKSGDFNPVSLRVCGNNFIARFDTYLADDYLVDITSEFISLKNNSSTSFTSTLYLISDSYISSCNPYNWFDFIYTSQPNQSLTVSRQEQGILLSADSAISGCARFLANGSYFDENSFTVTGVEFNVYTTETSVLVTCNSDCEVDYFIDLDKDGIYQDKIEKGDANGNGTCFEIDDAYLILLNYTYESVGSSQFLNTDICDINKDDTIDPDDAYEMLSYYCSNSLE